MMILIREIVSCRPGKVRPMVDKFLATAKLSQEHGLGQVRVMTDVSAERYWTVVAEIEVSSLEAFMKVGQGPEKEEYEAIWKGYHDLVESGRREIYRVEE
jgi:hypothetical protein